LDSGILLTIILVRYNLNDLTSTQEFYAMPGEFINIGYLKDVILITVMLLLGWLVIGKAFYFVGIYSNQKCLFATVCMLFFSMN
jgi:hypothetical protein